MFYKMSKTTFLSSSFLLYVCFINIKTFIMKKKRSIQKLEIHKETISNLNTIKGGAVTTTVTEGLIVIYTIIWNCNEITFPKPPITNGDP